MQKRLTDRHAVLDKTLVNPRNHVLDEGADLPRGRGNFGGGPRHSKALGTFAAASRSRSLQ